MWSTFVRTSMLVNLNIPFIVKMMIADKVQKSTRTVMRRKRRADSLRNNLVRRRTRVMSR